MSVPGRWRQAPAASPRDPTRLVSAGWRLIHSGSACSSGNGVASDRSQASRCAAAAAARLARYWVGRHYRQQRAVAHQPRLVQRRLGRIGRHQLRPRRWRAQHPRMQHAGQHHVMDETGQAEHLGRQVEPRRRPADDAVVAGVLRRHGAAGFAVEADPVRQRPVAFAAAVGMQELAGGKLQRRRRTLERSGGRLQEQVTRSRPRPSAALCPTPAPRDCPRSLPRQGWCQCRPHACAPAPTTGPALRRRSAPAR